MHLGFTLNEYQKTVSKHRCDDCGGEFTVCPPRPITENTPCLGVGCPSYDESKDVDKMLEGGAMLERGDVPKPN